MKADIENRIREIADEINSRMKGERPSVFDRKKWTGKVLEQVMRDEAFKVQLFRFIDVLPSLKSDSLVVRMLKEYFGDKAISSPLLRAGAKGIPSKGIITGVAGKVIRSNVEALARQFIAGVEPRDAIKPLELLWNDGYAFSVDLLGEVVVSEEEAAQYQERYLDLLDYLQKQVGRWKANPVLESDERGPIPRLDISIKISSFYSQLDPLDWDGSIERTAQRLRPIFKRAGELGAAVTFDMEHYQLKDLTLAVFKSVLDEFGGYPFGGIVIQSYLRESRQDLFRLIEWLRKRGRTVTVRLAKGAYWDYETVINRQRGWPVPVFLDKAETDRNYEDLTRLVMKNAKTFRPAIASHNIRSISHAIATAEAFGIPPNAFEFQMLYGMAEPLRRAIRDMGYRLRVYSPLGELIPGMAYIIRRLLENSSNEAFLRKSFFEETPFDELIAPPAVGEKEAPEEQKQGFRNVPPSDFSKAETRKKMQTALRKVRRTFGARYPLYIGKNEIRTERESVSSNPAMPDEVVGRVSSAGRDEADMAVLEARRTWQEWGRTPVEKRAGILLKAADLMRKRRFELAALEVFEAGKPWPEADGDVAEAIDYLMYYAGEMTRLDTANRLGNYPGEENEYLYEPKGVGVVLSPWNFPLAIPTGMVSAGIVTGNCIIFKPSGLTPVLGWKLVEVFRDAGLPPCVLQFVPGPGKEVGEYLVRHPGVDFIAFTGSRDVGLTIVKLAGDTPPGQKNVKRVVAEMGGKNAIIMDETADLDEAVKGVLVSALGYQGQKCSACSRVIVVGEAYDEFLRRLGEAMKSVNIGPPDEPGNFMGPVIDEQALRKVRRYIRIGKREGTKILERKVRGNGLFVGPVLFADVDPLSRIAQEEIFGPVVVAMRARDIDEAIDIANATDYALTGGVFSRSPANIKKVKESFVVGNLYINRNITGALVGRQPFGGFGMSGVGSKAGGPDYLLQFLNPRSISENTLRRGFAPEKLRNRV